MKSIFAGIGFLIVAALVANYAHEHNWFNSYGYNNAFQPAVYGDEPSARGYGEAPYGVVARPIPGCETGACGSPRAIQTRIQYDETRTAPTSVYVQPQYRTTYDRYGRRPARAAAKSATSGSTSPGCWVSGSLKFGTRLPGPASRTRASVAGIGNRNAKDWLSADKKCVADAAYVRTVEKSIARVVRPKTISAVGGV